MAALSPGLRPGRGRAGAASVRQVHREGQCPDHQPQHQRTAELREQLFTRRLEVRVKAALGDPGPDVESWVQEPSGAYPLTVSDPTPLPVAWPAFW